MASAETRPVERWLDLSEAAVYLGVHFTTLRRWSDAGEVACIRTPGGRRRYALSDLQRFLERLRQAGRYSPVEALEARTLALARQELRAHYAALPTSLPEFDEEARARFRDSGQKLLGLLIQFGSRSDAGEAFLDEGRRLAAGYGALCRQAGMSVSDTVRAFLFFGHSMLHTVQEAGALSGPYDEEGLRLYQRMSAFLDTILLATVESYCTCL
jgi:excisionase family DNA binding protein